MATTTPQQAFPVPTDSDDPDVPGDMLALANAIEKRVVGIYNSVADRDAKIVAPQEGQVAYLKDANRFYYYNGADWDYMFPEVPTFTTGSTVPNNASGSDGDVYFKV